jgi:hypothetical protein
MSEDVLKQPCVFLCRSAGTYNTLKVFTYRVEDTISSAGHIFGCEQKSACIAMLAYEVLRALLAQGSRTYGVPVWVVSGDTGVAAGTLLR